MVKSWHGCQKATKILVKNWLEKNYTIAYGNIWKDTQNRENFLKYVDYVHGYVRHNNIRWRSACLKLCKDNDRKTGDMLLDLKVLRAVVQFLAAIEPQITLFLDS